MYKNKFTNVSAAMLMMSIHCSGRNLVSTPQKGRMRSKWKRISINVTAGENSKQVLTR